MIQASTGSQYVPFQMECQQRQPLDAIRHEEDLAKLPLLGDLCRASNTSASALSTLPFGDDCSLTDVEAEMAAMLSELMSLQHAGNALPFDEKTSIANTSDARANLSPLLPTSISSLPPSPSPLSTPAALATPAPPAAYPKLFGVAVLATHSASLISQLVSSLSPYVAPDLFARWANEMVCVLVRPEQELAAQSVECKVLRIGNAVFTPGMMVAPYFALLALGDLVCWAMEVRTPGCMPFQGDSLANLIGWINTRGWFAKLCEVLGPAPQKTGGKGTSGEPTLRERAKTCLLDKLRKALARHDDPKWQKSVAMQIRRASAAAFVMLIARLPFSDDTSSLPAGLLDYYGWLEKAGAVTKLAAASTESLMKPPSSGAVETAEAGGGENIDENVDNAADLQSIRIAPADS